MESWVDLSRKLVTEAKQTPERAWLSEVSSAVLHQSLQDADRAYRNFFRSLRAKDASRRVGAPRLRTRRDKTQTVRFTRNSFRIRQVSGERALLRLTHVPSELRVRLSRPLPSPPSSVTVMRKADGTWHASFVVEVPEGGKRSRGGRRAGLDLGLADFVAVVASDGTRSKIENPRYLRVVERRLAKAQQALSRKVKGSGNREKARLRLAKLHSRVARTRLDFHRKQALTLVRENQAISVENLNVVGLARAGVQGRHGRGLRKSVYDAGWGQFLTVLEYKAEEYGRVFLRVSPAYTSQTCSVCGVLDGPKPLQVRVWTCSVCGSVLDRDWNAAVNILVAAGHAETLNACGEDVRRQLAAADLSEAGTEHVSVAS